MKLLLLIALLALVAVFATPEVDETRFLFNTWIKTHDKSYGSVAEVSHRFEIFQSNMELVFQHNEEAAEGKHTYTLGLNQFADLTNAEYRAIYLGYSRTNATRDGPKFVPRKRHSAPPASVDWRTKGAVTPIKDQGQCGSCWSFSATGTMEGAVFLKTGTLVSLSEQNLVDCVQDGSYTCETGGIMQDAYAYVIQQGGIEDESDYPYCGIDCDGESCEFSASKIAADISSYQNVDQTEAALLTATVQQPVSIAIDASSYQFQLYSGGVFNLPSCSSTQLDHGVLSIGYGTYNNVAYWLVKNSWGTSWGMQGYIMMSRNKSNQCGVATDASIAIA